MRERKCAAQCLLLHVAVARTRDAAGGERKLQQSGAVDAEAGFSSPKIGCSQKSLRDRDEIGFHRLHGCDMETGHVTAGGGNRERLLNTHNRKPASERKRFHRGKLDGGGGKDESTQRADLVGGRSSGSAKRACREISDIAVGGELPPRPPFLADVVDRKALAL